ncbi:MAG: SDR family NAD(P)-dependent oxidoreductase [Pirellulales bacterium]
MHYWQDKVALVTGASSGLGAALAETLVEKGAKVALAARGQDRLHRFADALRQRGGDVLPVAADVTSQADVERLFEQSGQHFGRLDLLVNCAGKSARAELRQLDADHFDELMELNFLAAVRCTQAAMPHLIQSRGHVVHIGSLSSKVATRYLGGYPASKFALAAYAQQLRLELGPAGLHVLLVCPGPIAREQCDPYDAASAGLPESASRPGGGARISAIDPHLLARRILDACRRRKAELIVPGRARLLFALAQLSPRLGDWLVRRMT